MQTELSAGRPGLEFESLDIMRSRNWWGDLSFDEAFFQWADGFDLFIVGGGGLINAGTRDAKSGFTFDVSPKLLQRSHVPVVFYSIGVNLFPGEMLAHPSQLNTFLDIVHGDPCRFLFSLRNDGSLERLEALLSRRLDFVTVVPDPGMYINTVKSELPQFSPGRRHVLVQLAGDRPELRFGSDRKSVLTRLARALGRIASAWDIDFVLAPHLLCDMAPLAELMELCPPTLPRFRCNSLGVVRGAKQAPNFFNAYQQADLVIGMRGHSAICSIGLGTPFIGLGGHDKLGGFLTTSGLGRYVVDMTDQDLEGRLIGLVDELLGMPSKFQEQSANVREQARLVTRDFHKRIYSLIRKDCARTESDPAR